MYKDFGHRYGAALSPGNCVGDPSLHMAYEVTQNARAVERGRDGVAGLWNIALNSIALDVSAEDAAKKPFVPGYITGFESTTDGYIADVAVFTPFEIGDTAIEHATQLRIGDTEHAAPYATVETFVEEDDGTIFRRSQRHIFDARTLQTQIGVTRCERSEGILEAVSPTQWLPATDASRHEVLPVIQQMEAMLKGAPDPERYRRQNIAGRALGFLMRKLKALGDA